MELSSKRRKRMFIFFVFLAELMVTSESASPLNSRFVVSFRGGAQEPRDVERMPSLFGSGEEAYDRYAACIAATEGLRRLRDEEIADAAAAKRPSKLFTAEPNDKDLEEAKRRIASKYLSKSKGVINALGMTVSQFNAIGREVKRDKKLKHKINEQASLYRMAATIDMNKIPYFDEHLDKAGRKARSKERFQDFCDSMVEIEQLQHDQINRLTRSLHVESLPKSVVISDPSIRPLLSPKVRAVVDAFPLQAAEIAKKHGIDSDEFNDFLDQTRKSPRMRWKLKKQMKRHDDPKNGGKQ